MLIKEKCYIIGFALLYEFGLFGGFSLLVDRLYFFEELDRFLDVGEYDFEVAL